MSSNDGGKQSLIGMIRHFFRAYPKRTLAVQGSLLLAGMLEGVGVASLVPVLTLVTETGSQGGTITRLMTEGLGWVGLPPTLGVLLGLSVVMIFLKSIVTLFAFKQVGYMAEQVANDLRITLIRSLLEARWQHFTSLPLGASANAIAAEADRASGAYIAFCRVSAAVMQVAIYAVIAMMVSWQMTLAALAIGMGLVYAVNGLVRYVKRAGDRQTRLMRSILSHLTDALGGVKAIKAMGREENFARLLREEMRDLRIAKRRQVLGREALNQVYDPIMALMLGAGFYLAITYGGIELTALIVMGVIFYRMVSKIALAHKAYQNMVVQDSAFWAMTHAIEQAQDARETLAGRQSPVLNQAIRLKDVTFSHGQRPLFEDISLEFPARRMTAVVGPSGSGKTTLFDLIAGLNVPGSGEVLLDETPLGAVDIRAWRQSIGYVPQETYLFNDTVRNNVTLGETSCTDADVEAALRRAGAWPFVSLLAQGLDTPVGEKGMLLSGGQRQRISIARALIGNPLLLLLDEATSALDRETEREILGTVKELAATLTVIAISHNESVLSYADRVYRIENGRFFDLRAESLHKTALF